MVSILSKPLKRLSRLARIHPPMREALMHHWYDTELGRAVVAEEQACLKTVLKSKFGHHLIQLDSGLYQPLDEKAPVGCQTLLSWHENRSLSPLIRGEPEQLPFLPGSIDQIVLHHTLDFCQDPHRVLREASQALVSGGHIVIVGFNPFSFWMLKKIGHLFSGQLPWAGRFMRASRLEDWLRVLDFEVEERYSLFHRPPFKRKSWLERMMWMDKLVRWGLPKFGASYILVAQKQEAGMTSLPVEWRRSMKATKRVARPEVNSSRQDNNG